MNKKYAFLVTLHRKQLYSTIIQQIEEIEHLKRLIDADYYEIEELRLRLRNNKILN